jgi:hypothetical protein
MAILTELSEGRAADNGSPRTASDRVTTAADALWISPKVRDQSAVLVDAYDGV